MNVLLVTIAAFAPTCFGFPADTQADDEGLRHLAKLPVLKSLDLSGTKVTDGSVAELQAAMPACRIKR